MTCWSLFDDVLEPLQAMLLLRLLQLGLVGSANWRTRLHLGLFHMRICGLLRRLRLHLRLLHLLAIGQKSLLLLIEHHLLLKDLLNIGV